MKKKTKGSRHKTFLREYCHLEGSTFSPSFFDLKDGFKENGGYKNTIGDR